MGLLGQVWRVIFGGCLLFRGLLLRFMSRMEAPLHIESGFGPHQPKSEVIHTFRRVHRRNQRIFIITCVFQLDLEPILVGHCLIHFGRVSALIAASVIESIILLLEAVNLVAYLV